MIAKCTEDDSTTVCIANSKEELVTELKRLLKYDGETVFVTWNGSRFDFPMLQKVYGLDLTDKRILHIDGMILSKVQNHARQGGHSLANVCVDLFPHDITVRKAEIDFGEATETELAAYCLQDVDVTLQCVQRLLKYCSLMEGKGSLREVMTLEQQVAGLIQEQVEVEVHFDVPLAESVYNAVITDMAGIEMLVEPLLPESPLTPSALHHPPKEQFKMDGTPHVNIKKYCDKYGYDVSLDLGRWKATNNGGLVPITKLLPLTEPLVLTKKTTLGMQAEIKNLLLDRGWRPSQHNYKMVKGRKVNTSPRLTDKITKEPCPNLSEVDGDWVKDVARWLMLRSRKNILMSDRGTGWIHKARASKYSTMPSDGDSMGANTNRWTHKGIANVPRITSSYGHAIRSCFNARDGMQWVGWDADSLEARIEAHYTYRYDGGVYATELMEGDVHTKNQETLGLESRDQAKTFKYAVTYGARPATLAKTLKCTTARAEEIYKEFWESNPALALLRRDLTKEWEVNGRRYIKGLDGRPIHTRSKHSLLNALFQSAGAIVMKRAMVFANADIREELPKEEAYGLIRYHDEEIWECLPKHAGRVAELGEKSVTDAGIFYSLNVKLTAEAKVGDNWANVH